MKIAALSPQFVIESPPGEEGKDAERVQRHLSIAKVEAPSESSQQETRNGLKRLAEFISRQRRAPEHAVPEAPTPDLREKRVFDSSHEYTKIVMAWSNRPVVLNSMAQVIADELKRRRGLRAYKKMQSITRKKEETHDASEEQSDLPAVIGF